jgi:hypothetical protein
MILSLWPMKEWVNSKTLMMVIIPIMAFLFSSLIFIYLIVHLHHENHTFLNQMNAVQQQITQLSEEDVNTDNVKSSLAHISTDISAIKSEEALTATSTDMNKVENQLAIIKQAMDELKKLAVQNNNGKEFIDAKNLPFKVLSVDVIAQQPFVSIQYDHHITPLGIGDTIAGWQIVDADYSNGSVEFKNNQSQYIKVNLQNLQG